MTEASTIRVWKWLTLVVGVLLGAAFFTLFLTFQANHRLAAVLVDQDRAARASRAAIACTVHDIVDNQRTMLLAIRDLVEPDRGPISKSTQAILDQLDRRISALVPIDVSGLDCPKGGSG